MLERKELPMLNCAPGSHTGDATEVKGRATWVELVASYQLPLHKAFFLLYILDPKKDERVPIYQ
jgi:hypothetical protein